MIPIWTIVFCLSVVPPSSSCIHSLVQVNLQKVFWWSSKCFVCIRVNDMDKTVTYPCITMPIYSANIELFRLWIIFNTYFNKSVLPNLSNVYRIYNILTYLSHIFLFSISIINLSSRSTNDTEWRGSLGSDRYNTIIYKMCNLQHNS